MYRQNAGANKEDTKSPEMTQKDAIGWGKSGEGFTTF